MVLGQEFKPILDSTSPHPLHLRNLTPIRFVLSIHRVEDHAAISDRAQQSLCYSRCVVHKIDYVSSVTQLTTRQSEISRYRLYARYQRFRQWLQARQFLQLSANDRRDMARFRQFDVGAVRYRDIGGHNIGGE